MRALINPLPRRIKYPMHSLLKNTALVTLFTAFEHFLGFLYRIILSRTLGAEGLGVYQAALAVFSVFLTAASSGLPVTLSRTIAKHRAGGQPVREHAAVTSAVLISLAFSVPATVLLFVFRTPFTKIFADARSADIFYIYLFGLSFTSLYTVIRGSFWGNKRFFAYSFIELIEEISMIAIGVILILLVPSGVSPVNKAAIALLTSHLLSFAIALVYHFAKGGRFASPRGEFLPLLKSSLPVTAMRTSSSLINSLISVLFPLRMLAAGFTSARAMSDYGVVYGMVMPVLTIPSTLIGSIALVLVPELSECYYKQQKEKLSSLVEKALNVTLLVAVMLVPLFFVCGQSVGVFLFSDAESGKMLSYCALMLLPISLTMISTSMLNSMGCEKQTLVFFLAGSAAMLLSVWFLPEYLGSGALLVGMALDYLVTAVCSLCLLRKKAGRLRTGKRFCLLVLAALPALALGYGLRTLLMHVLGYVPATVIVLIVMLLCEGVMLKILKLFDAVAFLGKFLPKRRRRAPQKAAGK